MTYLKAFIAGFASTLVFHQGLLWLYTGGFSPRAPWNMTPVPPLNGVIGVRHVISCNIIVTELHENPTAR
jgi:hypothetical protein